MFTDENEDNVILHSREKLHEYFYEDGYGKKRVDYFVYNPVALTIRIYKDEFKYSCYLMTLTRNALKFIALSEWRNYIEQIFESHMGK